MLLEFMCQGSVGQDEQRPVASGTMNVEAGLGECAGTGIETGGTGTVAMTEILTMFRSSDITD